MDERGAITLGKKRRYKQQSHAARVRLLLEKLSNIESGYQKLLHAYHFAHDAHLGQMRISGEPFIIHPTSVGLHLRSRGNSLDTVIAGFLHDVVEDTGVTKELLEEQFGGDIARLLFDRVLAWSALPTDHIISNETIRPFLEKHLRDPRVAEICLCDRLHNLQTVHWLPPVRKNAVIEQTLEIVVPVARAIGKDDLADELELVAIMSDDALFKAQRRRYEQLSLAPSMQYAYPFSVLALGETPFIDDFPTHLRDFLPRKTTLDEAFPIPSHSDIAHKLDEIQEALADLRAPSLKSLLGSVGPIDLKGLWVWGDYLLSFSQRAKETQSLIEEPEHTASSALTQLDRKVGGIVDVLIAFALRSKTSTIGKIAGFIKHLKTPTETDERGQ